VPPPTLKRTSTTIYLDDDLREGLKALKERDGISEAEAIRRAVRGFLQLRKALVPSKARKKGG
jgi:hypothetical protein